MAVKPTSCYRGVYTNGPHLEPNQQTDLTSLTTNELCKVHKQAELTLSRGEHTGAPLWGRGGRGFLQPDFPKCRAPCRGGGEPTHRGCLGNSWQWTHSLLFTPMCHCPFTGFLKGDPQPCGMAQPRRPGQIPPQQVPGSHSPPMFLFPWDPLDMGPELSVSSLKLFFCWPFAFLLLAPPPFSASLRDLVPSFPFS